MSSPVGGQSYTHGHAEAVLRSHRARTAANSAGYLLPHLRPGDHLLDVGCGPGTISVDLATLLPQGRVVATDLDETALTETRRLVDERGLANVEVQRADTMALPYDDDSFDVVHAHQVLQHVADPVGALTEMRRVCRSGGLVAARDADYLAMAWYPAVAELDLWRDLYRRVARANGGEPDAGRHLLHWARAAGFRHIESTASVWCFAEPEQRSWWSETWSERVRATRFGAQALERGWADRGTLESIAAGWQSWGAAPDGWFAVLHGGVLCRA